MVMDVPFLLFFSPLPDPVHPPGAFCACPLPRYTSLHGEDCGRDEGSRCLCRLTAHPPPAPPSTGHLRPAHSVCECIPGGPELGGEPRHLIVEQTAKRGGGAEEKHMKPPTDGSGVVTIVVHLQSGGHAPSLRKGVSRSDTKKPPPPPSPRIHWPASASRRPVPRAGGRAGSHDPHPPRVPPAWSTSFAASAAADGADAWP